MAEIKQKIYNVIREDHKNTISGTLFDTIIVVFIMLNITFIIIETFNPPSWFIPIYNVVEFITVVVYTIEYFLRIWTAPLKYPEEKTYKARLKYMISFMAIIDLMSILPAYLPFVFVINFKVLRILKVFKLLRVFKIGRYVDSFSAIVYVLKSKAHQLISSVIILFVLLIMASVIMYDIESQVQPEVFENALSSLWWAVATVTTVGYGDLYPITTAGKILGIVVVLMGVGLVAIPTGIISAGFVESIGMFTGETEINSDDKQLINNKQITFKARYCPYCGKPMEEHEVESCVE